MEIWHILAIIGLIMLVIEILTPTMFFLNIAIACFITAACSVFIHRWDYLIYILVATSAFMLIFIYPFLLKYNKGKKIETGLDKYIGKQAKVTEKVTKNSGNIRIYDEVWSARIESGKDISTGETVEIYKNNNLIMYVRKDD